jgi:hypothetical protein
MGRAGGRFDRVYFSLASLLRHFPNRVARRRGNGASGSRAANAPTNSRQDRDDRRQQIRREDQRRELQRICEHISLNIVGGPLLNKMIDCDMLPGGM